MKDQELRICESFIANRDELRKAVKLENMRMYITAADMLAAAGVVAGADKLKELRKIIKEKVSSISYLVGRSELPMLVELFLAPDPEALADKINRNYEIMKKICGRSTYTAMFAILFSKTMDEEQAAQIAERAKVLWNAFKKKHSIITSDREIASACFLAFSEKSDEQLIDECEAVHSMLKKAFGDSCFPQVCAHILCMTDGDPEAKVQRLLDLFHTLKDCKKKYRKGQELNMLAALSLTDLSVKELAESIIEIDAFLSKQKDYGAFSGIDTAGRLLNAAMLTATAYADPGLTPLNIMAALIAFIAEQDTDDASTAAIIASV